MCSVGPPAFLGPSRLCPLAGSDAARLAAGRSAAPTRAGWPPITTRISTWSASCCPSACTRISTTSTRSAAGRTIWATRSAIPAESLRLLAWWRGELDAMYAGRATPSGLRRAAGHRARSYGIPRAALRRSDRRLRAGSDRHALSQLGRAVRLLPLFRESRRAAGAGPVRLSRRRAAARFPTPPAPRCNSPTSGRM